MKSAMMLMLALIVAPEVAMATNAKGLAFLAENKDKEGVVELPCVVDCPASTPALSSAPLPTYRIADVLRLCRSGLQYKVITAAAAGAKSPKPSTPCECHYRGTLIDGTEFDSSYKRGQPATFAPNQVVKGWTEAMQLMGEGDKWELYIPSELGYGDRDRGQFIKGGDVLVFELEMLKVKGDSKPKP